jgi:hypothetical protein
MKWIVEKLLLGESVTFNPRGNSMTPKIKNGQQVTVVQIHDKTQLKKNDIVFCKVSGSYYLHLVYAVNIELKKVLIGNNHGHLNGWTSFSNIFGKIEP